MRKLTAKEKWAFRLFARNNNMLSQKDFSNLGLMRDKNKSIEYKAYQIINNLYGRGIIRWSSKKQNALEIILDKLSLL